MGSERDYLSVILARKRREVARRRVHAALAGRAFGRVSPAPERGSAALAALRRPAGGRARIIAEIKFRSPSAGPIRERRTGDAQRIAEVYATAGASAISVLADGPGFGGGALDVRRVASAVRVPVLFKGFVLDEIQVELARAVGASLILLIVRALDGARLDTLVRTARSAGLEPVVEAADRLELERALASGASIVGVNARDLETFRVDVDEAQAILSGVPEDRVAVFMSGVRNLGDVERLSSGRADALLVGESLMRAPDQAALLRSMSS